MKHVDVVKLTQEAVAQTMGAEYMEKLGDISFLDSYKLADVGRDVTASGTVDVFSKKLVGLLGKMVIDAKRYKGSVIKSIFVIFIIVRNNVFRLSYGNTIIFVEYPVFC